MVQVGSSSCEGSKAGATLRSATEILGTPGDADGLVPGSLVKEFFRFILELPKLKKADSPRKCVGFAAPGGQAAGLEVVSTKTTFTQGLTRLVRLVPFPAPLLSGTG